MVQARTNIYVRKYLLNVGEEFTDRLFTMDEMWARMENDPTRPSRLVSKKALPYHLRNVFYMEKERMTANDKFKYCILGIK